MREWGKWSPPRRERYGQVEVSFSIDTKSQDEREPWPREEKRTLRKYRSLRYSGFLVLAQEVGLLAVHAGGGGREQTAGSAQLES